MAIDNCDFNNFTERFMDLTLLIEVRWFLSLLTAIEVNNFFGGLLGQDQKLALGKN